MTMATGRDVRSRSGLPRYRLSVLVELIDKPTMS